MVSAFTGSWYQPSHNDDLVYAGNYRFSPTDSGYSKCVNFGSGAWTEDITFTTVNGAAVLTAGAAIVALTMMY